MSSKIRTLTHLNQRLSEEIAWRKKELIYINSLVQKEKPPIPIDTLIRSGITMLYAHWEGFVKSASIAYVEFVMRQNLNHDNLSTNFVAMAIRDKIVNWKEGDQTTIYLEVAELLMERASEKCLVQWEKAISTKSNLKSIVFRDIVRSLGLSYDPLYESRENLIDAVLVHYRNNIAHGSGKDLLIDKVEYGELHKKIIEIMDLFLNQIENAAVLKQYLSKKRNFNSVP